MKWIIETKEKSSIDLSLPEIEIVIKLDSGKMFGTKIPKKGDSIKSLISGLIGLTKQLVELLD